MPAQIYPYTAAVPSYPHPVNAYLVVTPGGEAMLVDTGPDTDEAWTALTATLNRAGIGWGALRHILLTHGHHDHYGLSARIVAETGAAAGCPGD